MAGRDMKLRATALLILYGMVMVVALGQTKSLGAKACPLYCLDVAYITCPSSGHEQLSGRCNCCLAPKGCTLHLSDGSSVHCT